MIKLPRLLPLLTCALLSVGATDTLADEGPVTDDKARSQAQGRRGEASAIRHAAEIQHKDAQTLCWKKFLVSSCLIDAAKALRDEKSRAYALEKDARDIERSLRKREFAAREAKRLDPAPALAGNPQ